MKGALHIGVLLGVLACTHGCWPNFLKYLSPSGGSQGGQTPDPQYDSVDCGATGVFTLAPPYDRSYWKHPQCPDVIRPIFTVFTRSSRDAGHVITDHGTIPSVFDRNSRSVFLAHGFHDDTDAPWVREFIRLLTDKYLNVITVDWRHGADVGLLHYDLPASNTRTVGAQTALVMRHLVVTGGTAWGRLWCMGHSLGAHVCGLAGMRARALVQGGVVGRVTGFDPAGVNFEKSADLTVGLNPISAAFVDVIHTTTILGTKRTLGHMDFYPSDGDFQDGCITATCGHSRSEEYFRESIVNDCFLATEQCTDFAHIPRSCRDMGRVVAAMGYYSDVSGDHGIYRMNINDKAPFCTGAGGMTYTTGTPASSPDDHCVCVTGSSVNIRESACGAIKPDNNMTFKADKDACYKPLSEPKPCELSGKKYNFTKIDYIEGGGWIANSLLTRHSARQCPGEQTYCSSGDKRITHQEAMTELTKAGISTASSKTCPDRMGVGCTSLENIRCKCITDIIWFKAKLSSTCAFYITGGTEYYLHTKNGAKTHYAGYKLDISLIACVTNTITTFEKLADRGDGAPQYKDTRGNIYAKESHHWDIKYP